MKTENMVRFKRIYGIILSISIILAGISLIAGCIYIYSSGEQPYSREIVGEVFSKISFPVYACLVLILGSIVLGSIFPEDASKKQIKTIEKRIKRSAPRKKQIILRGIILTAGIGLLLLGFFSGGTADVLTKAVNICTECIGLG